jgi:exodeoxyribonuclease VII small subunit
MEEMSFEDAMEKLESLVKRLEGGSSSLEESIKMFEEGMSLLKFCDTKLEQAEHKIEKLIEVNGETKIDEFED